MARKKTIIEKLRDHHEHDGHKQRLRERLYKMPDSLADHELLEIILSSSIVRRDTNKIARRLIRNYGSIHNVIEQDEHSPQKKAIAVPHFLGPCY